MAAHNEVGEYGETTVARLLSNVSDVQRPGQRADLRFEGLEIEVKTSTISSCNGKGITGYQFCLEKTGHTTLEKADVLILVCVSLEPEFFIIPAGIVEQRRKIYIPVNVEQYTGIWSQYRNNWETLAGIV